MTSATGHGTTLATVDDIVAEARAGRMFVLLERGRHGPEGTLAVAAGQADAAAVNYLARHARGLVCLALDEEIVDRLRLSLMPQTNRARIGTAYTVSVEAAQGISTGISAADRALTIATAIAPDARPADLVSPGHVSPIRVERDELLLRPSAPAAAVEVCRAAGLVPAAVTCALMTPEGATAGLAETLHFAEEAGLRVIEARALRGLAGGEPG